MGVDCQAWIGTRSVYLDRWYTFSDRIEQGRPMSKKETLAAIDALIVENEEVASCPEEEALYCLETAEYRRHWLHVAKAAVEEKAAETDRIIFYPDSCEEYYSMCRYEETMIQPMKNLSVEELARELHEAGREAVEKGATVAADHHGEKARTFLGWEEITENAREGRRIQARYLLERYVVCPK
jgi:hypothetical protein